MPAKGQKMSEETKQKISKANKGHVVSAETRAKISAANKGKVVSEEQKKKQSIAMKGHPSISGEAHWQWKGGKGFKFHEDARALWEKDHCQECKIPIEEYKNKYDYVNKFDMHCSNPSQVEGEEGWRDLSEDNWSTYCKDCHLGLHARLRAKKKSNNESST